MANNIGKNAPSQIIKREMQIEQHEIPPFAYHIGKSQRDNVNVSNNGNVNFKGYFSILIKNFKTYIP